MADHPYGDGDGDTPGVAELEAKSPAEAFEFLAGQVPELLRLRDRIAPTRIPVDPNLTFEESRERQRQLDGGGFRSADARKSMKGRVACVRSWLAWLDRE
jgi:hypothetical protein